MEVAEVGEVHPEVRDAGQPGGIHVLSKLLPGERRKERGGGREEEGEEGEEEGEEGEEKGEKMGSSGVRIIQYSHEALDDSRSQYRGQATPM